MANEACKLALELIAGFGPDARFFWVDKDGGRHERQTVSDLARAVLDDRIDPSELAQDRRTIPRNPSDERDSTPK